MKTLRLLPMLAVLCLAPLPDANHLTFADDKPAAKAAAAPYVKLPATVQGAPGSFITIPADTNGNAVAWRAVDPGLNLFPVSLLKDTKTAVVTGSTPGNYRVWAYTALADQPSDIAECVVTIGKPPPGPGPGPGPTDPLTKALQAAKDADADPTNFAVLVAAYKAMALTAGQQPVKTNADAVAWIRSQIHLPQGSLPNLNKAITDELTSAFGTSATAALTPAAFGAEIQKIATALQGVK